MAVGFAPGSANSILNLLCRATAWTPPAGCFVQLHVGDPGAAGTANVATETDRTQATFGTVAANSAGSSTISNTAAVVWTGVGGTEDFTHWSAWSASTSGTFLFSGTITANAVTVGDTFTLPIGDVDLAIPTAA
jgi:hypothetical protein